MKTFYLLFGSIMVSVVGTAIGAPVKGVVAVACVLFIIAHTTKDSRMV
jgi:hypothetical protein